MDMSIEISNFPDFIKHVTPPCSETDPDLFFPMDSGDPLYARNTKANYVNLAGAKSICKGCPVATKCLIYALEEGIEHGVWGGLTPPERQRLRNRR